MKYALIDPLGRLVQVEPAPFEAAGDWNWLEVADDVDAGTHHYDGENVVLSPPAAAPPPPTRVTMRQARLALLAAGKLQAVIDAVDGIPGPEGTAARIEWEYAQAVERGSPLVATLSAALDLDAGQLDALFSAAAGF